MKNSFTTLAIVAMLSLATLANAQSSASAGANASARVVKPITLQKIADLNFDGIIGSATSGTVVVNNNNTASYSGGVIALTGSNATPISAARFTVTGEPTFTYAISNSGGTVTMMSGSNSLVCTLAAPAAVSVTLGTLPSGGTQDFTVGGSLAVPANQPSGTYTGSWTETVAYN